MINDNNIISLRTRSIGRVLSYRGRSHSVVMMLLSSVGPHTRIIIVDVLYFQGLIYFLFIIF